MNNRELAAVILAAVLFVSVLLYSQTRALLPNLLRAFFTPKLFVPLLTYAAGLGSIVWLAARVDLWVPDLLPDTVFWFFLTGLVWYFNIHKAGEDPNFFRSKIVATLGIAAFFEFFINLETLPLIGELVLQIVLIFVVLMQAVAATKPEFRLVKRLFGGLAGLIVVGIVGYTVVALIGDWDARDPALLARKLFLPIWLTLASVPFIYVVALAAGYEGLFLHARFMNDKQRPSLRSLLGIMSSLRGSLVDIKEFRGFRLKAAVQFRSYRGARAEVVGFKRDRQADQERRAAARERLVRYEGVDGASSDGRRLDRREFAETKKTLQWLATCHMGWYRREDRYQPDLLSKLGSFEREGLPAPPGIYMRVSKNGQSWYAYRRTLTGWFFGIGANGAPPNQWLYDGSKPPKGFPGSHGSWRDNLSGQPEEWLPEDNL